MIGEIYNISEFHLFLGLPFVFLPVKFMNRQSNQALNRTRIDLSRKRYTTVYRVWIRVNAREKYMFEIVDATVCNLTWKGKLF